MGGYGSLPCLGGDVGTPAGSTKVWQGGLSCVSRLARLYRTCRSGTGRMPRLALGDARAWPLPSQRPVAVPIAHRLRLRARSAVRRWAGRTYGDPEALAFLIRDVSGCSPLSVCAQVRGDGNRVL